MKWPKPIPGREHPVGSFGSHHGIFRVHHLKRANHGIKPLDTVKMRADHLAGFDITRPIGVRQIRQRQKGIMWIKHHQGVSSSCAEVLKGGHLHENNTPPETYANGWFMWQEPAR